MMEQLRDQHRGLVTAFENSFQGYSQDFWNTIIFQRFFANPQETFSVSIADILYPNMSMDYSRFQGSTVRTNVQRVLRSDRVYQYVRAFYPKFIQQYTEILDANNFDLPFYIQSMQKQIKIMTQDLLKPLLAQCLQVITGIMDGVRGFYMFNYQNPQLRQILKYIWQPLRAYIGSAISITTQRTYQGIKQPQDPNQSARSNFIRRLTQQATWDMKDLQYSFNILNRYSSSFTQKNGMFQIKDIQRTRALAVFYIKHQIYTQLHYLRKRINYLYTQRQQQDYKQNFHYFRRQIMGYRVFRPINQITMESYFSRIIFQSHYWTSKKNNNASGFFIKLNPLTMLFLVGSRYNYHNDQAFYSLQQLSGQAYQNLKAFPFRQVITLQLVQMLYRYGQMFNASHYLQAFAYDQNAVPDYNFNRFNQQIVRFTRRRQIQFSFSSVLICQDARWLAKTIKFSSSSPQGFKIPLQKFLIDTPDNRYYWNWNNFMNGITQLVPQITQAIIKGIQSEYNYRLDKYAIQAGFVSGFRVKQVKLNVFDIPSFHRMQRIQLFKDKHTNLGIINLVYQLSQLNNGTLWNVFAKQRSQFACQQYVRYVNSFSQTFTCWETCFSFLLQTQAKYPQLILQQRDLLRNCIKRGSIYQIIQSFIQTFNVYVFWNQKQQHFGFQQCKQYNYCLVISGHHMTVASHSSMSRKKRTQSAMTITPVNNKYCLSKQQNKSQDGLFKQQQLPSIKQRILKQVNIQLFKVKNVDQYFIRQRSIYFDIQCFAVQQQYQQCYMLSYCGYPNDLRSQIKQTFGYKSKTLRPTLQFAYKIKEWYDMFSYTQQTPLIIWSFNGNKYDMVYLLQDLIFVFQKVQSWGPLSQTKGFSILNKSIVFRDFRLIMSEGSLKKLGKASNFNTLYKKHKYQIAKITNQHQLYDHQGVYQSVQDYCQQDCLALMSLVSQFYSNLKKVIQQIREHQYNNRKGGEYNQKKGSQSLNQKYINKQVYPIHLKELLMQPTAPSIALLLYKRVFLRKAVTDNQPADIKAYQRKYYCGGVTQVFKMWNQLNQIVYAFDINSSYPASMMHCMPWYYVRDYQPQQLRYYQQNIHAIPDMAFFIVKSFTFRGKQSDFPIIGIKTQDGLVYPYAYQGQVGVWGHTIRQTCSQVKFFKGCIYTDTYQKYKNISLRQYVQAIYPFKNKAKLKTQKTLYKLFLNSLYGKFGQRSFSQYQLLPSNHGHQFLDSIFLSYSNYQMFVQAQNQILNKNIGQFVRISSYISSRSRLALHQAAMIVQPSQIFYCDTDSLYITKLGKQRLIAKGFTDQKQLGKWKQQDNYQQVLFIGAKFGICFKKRQYVQPPAAQNSSQQQKRPKNVQTKTKGVDKKTSNIQNHQVAQQFYHSVKSQLDIMLSDIKPLVKRQLAWKFQSKRWVKDFTLGKLIIQHYNKKCSFFPKRQFDYTGSSVAIVYNQYEQNKVVEQIGIWQMQQQNNDQLF